MLSKTLRKTKASTLLLISLMIAVACGSPPTEPDVSVETIVAQTVAAQAGVETEPESAEPEPEDRAVETAVAQTVAAQNAVQLQVEQTVAAELAAQEAGQQTAVDANAPVAGIEPIKPEGDPNAASGTPQLRVSLSSVNVRNGPGTNYRVISTLLQDSIITVIAKNQNGSWFLIELPGGSRGWIAASVTEPVVAADMVNVPVAATIPPPPTATHTATPTATPTSTNTPEATPTPTNTPATSQTPTSTPDTTQTPTSTPTATNTPTNTPTSTATPTDPAPVPIPSTITVINNTAVDICFLFIDLTVDPWTDDRLGPNNILQPGFQISLDFPAGQYDFKAEDCNNSVIDTMSNVSISGPFTWDVQ